MKILILRSSAAKRILLTMLRVAWLALAVLLVALFLAGQGPRIRELNTICVGAGWLRWPALVADLEGVPCGAVTTSAWAPVVIHAFGLGGATLLFMVYLLFVGLLLKTALSVREPSGRLLAVGVASLFACQTVINLAMTVGLLPIVGMPLPFLSYGGSSLLTSFAALGLVLNVGSDHPVEFGRGDFD